MFVQFCQHNLKFKPIQCYVFKQEMKFPGKLVNGEGITISPETLKTVKKLQIQQNSKQLLSFSFFYELQSCSYNYHLSCGPLLAYKDFIRIDRHRVCFQELKKLAISAPHLSHPSNDVFFFFFSVIPLRATIKSLHNCPKFKMGLPKQVVVKQHQNY